MAENVSAEDALKKLDRKLECSLCLETYKVPKILPCFHIFCESPCLKKLVSEDGQSLQCPTCRHLVPLPANGVSGLQSDFHIANLFKIRDVFDKVHQSTDRQCDNCEEHNATGYCHDCERFLCDDCQAIHRRVKVLKTHNIVTLDQLQADAVNLVPPKKAVPRCPKHSNKELEIYCETCQELICSKCTSLFHEDHKYDLIRDIFAKHKEEIVSGLRPVREKLDTVQQTQKAFDSVAKEINEQRVTVEADIHKEFDQLQRLLDQRRVEVIGTLNLHTQQKLKSLATKLDQVEVKLTSCLEYAESGLETGTEEEVLGMENSVLKRIEQINAEFDLDHIQPETKAGVRFLTDSKEQLQTACQQFAEIISDGDHLGSLDNTGDDDPVSPRNSYIDKNTLEGVVKVGEKKSVEFHARTEANKEFTKDQLSLIAVLVHLKSKERQICKVVNQPNGVHKINYQPTTQGRHNLLITLDGVPVHGSPYLIIVSSLRDLNKPVRIVRDLIVPAGIAINRKGQVVVAEHQGNCISILTRNRPVFKRFGRYDSGNEQLCNPWGVTVDEENNIYISTKTTNHVYKFDSEGSLIYTIGDRFRFSSPAGMCYSWKDCQLYVCDKGNHRIQVFSPHVLSEIRCASSLRKPTIFGTHGTENGQFNNPCDIALDDAGNLYVTDYDNHRVQVFSASGTYLRAFSSKRNGEKLNCPSAIAIDSENTVFVGEDKLHCVSVFTSLGDYITSFGRKGTEEGEFNGIYGLTVDGNGSIIVSDSSNGRLQIF